MKEPVPQDHEPCPTCKGLGYVPTSHLVAIELREQRRELGLSQRRLANFMGCTQAHIHMLETHQRNWLPHQIAAAKRAFEELPGKVDDPPEET